MVKYAGSMQSQQEQPAPKAKKKKKPRKNLQREDVQRRCRQYIQDAREHTVFRDQKDRAELNQDFFRGGKHQWSQEDYDAYKSRGVTPISINRCKPVLKGLLGMYLQSRQEIRVRPRRGGSATVAQVHTEILKHTQDVSYADYVYAQVFMRGSIDTEAYLKLEIDWSQNPNGQPVFKGLSLWDVSLDRNATEYDLNKSCKYVIEREWLDKDEIEAMYPEKEMQDLIEKAVLSEDEFGTRPAERLATWMTSDGGMADDDMDEEEMLPDMTLLKKYRHLIQKVYWKEIKPALAIGDLQENKTYFIDDEKLVRKWSRKAKKTVRFKVHRFPQKILHETVMLGSIMLEDIENPLGEGVSDYPIVRYSPLWDLGYAVGALDDVVDLNREENIHRTQTIRILNQTANSGWKVGTASNKKYEKTLKNFGSVPGIIIPLDKFGNVVEKITPNPLPNHFVVGEQFERDIKRVSGVDDATQGYTTGQQESGRAINLKMQNNRTSNEIFFDNFYYTMMLFGNLMMQVHLNNPVYTDEEIHKIVNESSMIDTEKMAQARAMLTGMMGGVDLPEPTPLPRLDPGIMMAVKPEDQYMLTQKVKQGVESAQQYMKAYPQLNKTWEKVIHQHAIMLLLQELREDKGMYGTKVDVSPSAPTERLSQFLQMDTLMSKYGNLIPPDVFIDLTDLPQKEEIKAKIQAAQQQPQAAVIPPMMKGAA